MRSSKSRSRGNKNRPIRPTGGNIINRVFDSSGPDGKVRGTPQQIIEKYTQLHRDAQLTNDRVNAENFAQHAEHYTRLLAEATREVDRAREEQEQFNRDRQVERDRQIERDRQVNAERQSNGHNSADRSGNQDRPQQDRPQQDRTQQDRTQQDRPQQDRSPERDIQAERERQSQRDRERAQRLRAQEEMAADPSVMEQPDLAPVVDSGLVDTPEQARDAAPRAPRPPRGPRPDRQPKPEATTESAPVPEVKDDAPKASKPRVARARKPKPDTVANDPAEAAE